MPKHLPFLYVEDNPKKFELTSVMKVVFVPITHNGDATTCNNMFAKAEPQQHPFNDAVAKIIWHVRWTAKGLMPVKPALHLAGSAVIPPGKALALKA